MSEPAARGPYTPKRKSNGWVIALVTAAIGALLWFMAPALGPFEYQDRIAARDLLDATPRMAG